jgi:hypothetical protein
MGETPPFKGLTPPPQEFTSNYPRGVNPFAYVRPPGVYWDSLGIATNMILSNFWTYVGSTLIFMLCLFVCALPLYIILFGAFFASMGSGRSAFPVSPLIMLGPQLVLQFAGVFAQLCLIAVGVKNAQGQRASIEDFFIPFRSFGKTCKTCLLVSAIPMALAVVIALLEVMAGQNMVGLAIIAGISLICSLVFYVTVYATLLLAATAAVFTGREAIDCTREVYAKLGANTVTFGVLIALSFIASSLGALACGIGLLVSYPIATNVIALHYCYCFPSREPQGTAIA